MKVTVTHLKAPWPAGTVPGHVVELSGVDTLPAWAVGKCVLAEDDTEAVSVWAPTVTAGPVLVVNPASAEADADADAEARAAEALAAAERQHQAEVQAAEERATVPTRPKRGASV